MRHESLIAPNRLTTVRHYAAQRLAAKFTPMPHTQHELLSFPGRSNHFCHARVTDVASETPGLPTCLTAEPNHTHEQGHSLLSPALVHLTLRARESEARARSPREA